MSDSEITEALRNGIRAARRKDTAAARQWLRRVVEADPEREDAWLWLARVTEGAERRQALERALALNPDNRWAAQQLEERGAPPPVPGGATEEAEAAKAPPRPSTPRLETLQCPSCGGTVEIRNREGAKTVVCQFCGSVLDLTPEQAAIVGRSDLKIRPMQPIEPGMNATFDGTVYEVAGWLRYKGFDDEDLWMWDEWLLLGEDSTVRWLSYDPEEGFLLQDRVPITASFDPQHASSIPLPGGGSATVIERAQAELVVIRGELTWRATVGDRIRYLEARDGAMRYSIEFSTQELELSAGRRWSEAAIWKAFGREELAAEIQAESQQEAALKRLRNISFFLAVFSLLLFGMAGCSGSEALRSSVALQGDGAAEIVGTAELTADDVYRLRLECGTPSNAWSLISAWAYDAKDTKYLLGSLNCWHESGRDEDGYWEESQTRAKHIFKPATSGSYRFEVALEEASYGPVNANILVEAGIWHRPPFFFAFLLLLGLAWLLHRSARKT